MTPRIGILGNGSWSSALVKILTDNRQTLSWWMRNPAARQHLMRTGHNLHYLSSVRYDTQLILLEEDLQKCIEDAEIILMGVPSAFIVDVLKELPDTIFDRKIVLSAIKGILPVHNVLLNEYLKERFGFPLSGYVCIAGPCHAEEIAAEKLSYLTFASEEPALAQSIAGLFTNEYLQTVCSQDIMGVQYAAVLKNIYALGAGIAHGLDYGDNFLSVYITNCFNEMQQFMDIISTQNPHHYNSSVYLGDLLVTCYSMHSRNRRFGHFIGKGYSVQATQLELNMVAEGYMASKGIAEICRKLSYSLPIADRIHRILWNKESVSQLFREIETICH